MITIEYTTSNGYIVESNERLTGRGITLLENGAYQVTESAMNKLQQNNKVECNF